MKMIRDTRRAVEIVAASCAAVCHVFDLKADVMTAKTRERKIAWPRHLAMALAYERSGLVPGAIAPLFGKHRGTIVWAIGAVRDQRNVCQIAQRQWADCVRTYERMMQVEFDNPMVVASTCLIMSAESWNYPLFKHMDDNFAITLTESEMDDLIRVALECERRGQESVARLKEDAT